MGVVSLIPKSRKKSANRVAEGTLVLPLLIFILGWAARPSYGYGTFGFPIHHRFSDPVKQILDVGDGYKLPEKGTSDYFAALAHRDLVYHGRRLSAVDQSTPLTFAGGNSTYRLSIFGFLHYANVTVGTPGLSFLVALDTGSDLFWVPCDCINCVQGIRINQEEIDFSSYSLNTSSSGSKVPCNSPFCGHQSSCPTSPSACPYRVAYLSANTSSSGYLVEDVLHLTANDNLPESINAKIPFGCGKVETGSFLEGGAPNGLLGLGFNDISVPSMLASQKIATNSFSMCFGDDAQGRIVFGDNGSSDQGETPFNNYRQANSHYNVSIAQVSVGKNVSKTGGIYAIFDSGTSFTYLNDPAYSLIAESFDSQVKDNKYTSADIPFEYCYDRRSLHKNLSIPTINLVMQGGDPFYVTDPTITVSLQSRKEVYCLGIVKSEDVNIIGQNFMTGYRVVFDRERMVLGWKPSNCYEASDSTTLPISRQLSPQIPPISSIEPQATSRETPLVPPGASFSSCLSPSTFRFVSLLLLVFISIL